MPGGMPTLSNPNLPENVLNPFDRRLRALEDQMRGLMSTPQRVLDVIQDHQEITNFATLNTGYQTVLSKTFTMPAWASSAIVMAGATAQITNITAGVQSVAAKVRINGNDGVGFRSQAQQDVATGGTGCGSPFNAAILSKATDLAGGSTFLVETLMLVTTGTNGGNRITQAAMVLWLN